MKKGNWEYQRRKMVEIQLIGRGIRDKKVISAFLKVPRHEFVPPPHREDAYGDFPLPIGEGQTISQPYMVALMTELLLLKGEEKVLEIGTGSGYQTAILAEIAKSIYTVERIASLLERAKEILEFLGYKNIHFRVGDGTKGWEENAPYDAIIVTAASPEIPPPLFEQLKEGGRMVIPVGNRMGQDLIRVTKKDGKPKKENFGPCIFVPLIGEYGWKNGN
ncbi:protein-L-isoaspartate(D-aspartate) O-methyltransferase [Candidatus Calescamantes bacterium]|nr:protein-L-isoaspartate(D-aspartate) O-methyltransferase [Candidatus Calescamantes bacterium]